MPVDDTLFPYRSAAGQAILADLTVQQRAAWPVSATAQTVATRYGKTHVLITGDEDAPPLILFHDWGTNAASLYLSYDLEWLALQYRLIMPDTPGQPGQSAATPPNATGAAYGEWAAETLDSLGIREAFVVGSGGGGFLALKLAAHAPNRVIRAVVAGANGIQAPSSSALRVLAATLPLRLRPSHASARRLVRAVGAPDKPLTPAHEHTARQMALTAAHVRPFSAPPALTDAELAQIRAPVLLLLGAHDPTINAQTAVQRATSTILNAQVEHVSAGQLIALDAPGLIELRLYPFFGTLG
jgi:pimeloyl-ACP methyl ester carboxylesterase